MDRIWRNNRYEDEEGRMYGVLDPEEWARTPGYYWEDEKEIPSPWFERGRRLARWWHRLWSG